MKKVLLIVISIVLNSGLVYSQLIPKGISYQAVAINNQVKSVAGKNPENVYWSNRDIQVRFTIYNKYPNGTAQMVENHKVETDKFGVFNAVIGQGENISGDLFDVDWNIGQAHLQVEIDFENNGLYKLIGIERFWSVPYALNAANGNNSGGNPDALSKKLDSIVNDFNKKIADFKTEINLLDTSKINEIQDLEYSGNSIGLTKSDKKILLRDNEIGNELQSMALINDTLILSGLDTFSGKVQYSDRIYLDYDKSDQNELQELTIRNDSLILSISNSGVSLKQAIRSNQSGYQSSQPYCFDGDFIDLSDWASSNGWSKVFSIAKLSDSLFLFAASNNDNSISQQFVYDAKNDSMKKTNIGGSIRSIGACDSFLVVESGFGTGSSTLYKIDYNREVQSTGVSKSGYSWKRGPIVNTKGDLIWVEVNKGLPQDIKKLNFSSGVTNNYTNPLKGLNEGGFLRLNGDTILIGYQIYDSKNMVQIKSLPIGIFSKSEILFYSGPYLYFNKNSASYRYDLETGVAISLGSAIQLVGKIANGAIVNIGWDQNLYGLRLGGLSISSKGNIFISNQGEITFLGYGSDFLNFQNSNWINQDGSISANIVPQADGTIQSHCVNGRIPRSNVGFSFFY